MSLIKHTKYSKNVTPKFNSDFIESLSALNMLKI
jgi:hypothetical protein